MVTPPADTQLKTPRRRRRRRRKKKKNLRDSMRQTAVATDCRLYTCIFLSWARYRLFWTASARHSPGQKERRDQPGATLSENVYMYTNPLESFDVLPSSSSSEGDGWTRALFFSYLSLSLSICIYIYTWGMKIK